jgi:N-acetylmuramoyl-L-alanine amidase
MPKIDRIKRRMLQDLVEENLELIGGKPPGHRSRARHRWSSRLGVLMLLLSSAALSGSAGMIRSWSADEEPAVFHERIAARRGPREAPRPATLREVPAGVSASVFPLAVRKIVLDAGHGGPSSGTRTPGGLLEKEVTLDVAERVSTLLSEGGGFEVLMTRQEDREVSLADRAALANRAGADIFVSIHVNWIQNRDARGVETYYLGPTNDPFLNRLAAAENLDSGYSLADMRNLLDRLYANVRQDESARLARVVQTSLHRSLHAINPKLEDRGVKAAPFIVLLSTQMPAILAEVSCMSNLEESELLAKPLYRQYIADALANGIRAYAGGRRPLREEPALESERKLTR